MKREDETLYDYLMRTNPEFAKIYGSGKNTIKGNGEYVSFDDDIKAQEGGIFSKAWTWIATKSTEIKEAQDSALESATGGLKKVAVFAVFGIALLIIWKFNLGKDIKSFLRSW